MINEKIIEELCLKGESLTLDYKSEQYKFSGDKAEKSELLKDVLSFANAWREENAYILIGVSEVNGQGEIVGIPSTDIIDDAKIQQFINSKTNKLIPFSSYTVNCKKRIVQVIEFKDCTQERPLFAIKDYGNVTKEVVKIRRGTSTSDASPNEIVKMTEVRIEKKQPTIEACISSTGSSDYRKDEITLRTLDVDFENQHIESRQHDPVKNILNIFSNISSRNKQEWIKECFRICSINLKLKNLSDVQAKDLRIETGISNESINIMTLDYYPPKPQNGPVLAGIPFHNFQDRDVCIHPQDTHCEEKLFYLRPETSGTADLTVTVYGQNLTKPLIFKFKLNFLVEKNPLSSECLKDEYWDSLEEDIVFELLNKADEA